MSDTPRTDAVADEAPETCGLNAAHNRMLDHARQLERELIAAQKEIAELRDLRARYWKMRAADDYGVSEI